jgi:hypothetical protein
MIDLPKVACLLAVVAACSTDATTTRTPAQQAFWTAFNSGDYSAAPGLSDELQAEAQASPQDAERAVMFGIANIWMAAEAQRDPATAQQVQAMRDPIGMMSLGQALSIDPHKFFASGFLGVSTVDLGILTQDPSKVGQGWGLIDQAYADNSGFASFVKLTASRWLPPDDPKVQEAIDAMYSFYDDCIGGTLDRNNPDYTPYFTLATKPGGKRFCWNSDEAPHAFEGSFLWMGDALVKSGKLDAAKVFYQNAKNSPDFATWPHAAVITDRLSADLSARQAMYTGTDPTHWPQFGDGAYTCTVCHAKTGL